MYRRRLRWKACLLAVLTAALFFLLQGKSGGQTDGEATSEEFEKLVLPDPETGQAPEETWELPGKDALIRVLLLAEDGGLVHKEKDPGGEYPGTLDYYEEDGGWVIVNEAPLEEYLRLVVPGEMPSSYAEEALKAQAVCARTYAVWQLQEYAYPEYEAHVDDSVSYQVYNSIGSQPATDAAVEETAGEILLCGDSPVKAYYFSTSCGATTDENIWEDGDREQTPYLAGRRVTDTEITKDLSDEETFAAFIRKKHAHDLEISEPWYRWSCYIPLAQIGENIRDHAAERAQKSADGILKKDGEDYIWPQEPSVGEILSAEIIRRNTGGAAQELLITGSGGVLKIQYEYNIRLMLGIPGGEIHKNDGTVAEGSSLLPSGYFILEEVAGEDGAPVGYQAYGGGLGHGAGMSQNGARILAEQGYGYADILSYFYQDVRLARLE